MILKRLVFFAPGAWLAEAASGKPQLGDCEDAALSRFPIRQNCVCSELSWCTVPVLIIAPLSCSPPIYKDLLGSPLRLKFSFISTGVTAEPADSWSSFPPAAGKCGTPCSVPIPAFSVGCGTLAWPGWSSVGVLEDVMGVCSRPGGRG